jgi:2'-5' RNA ligase
MRIFIAIDFNEFHDYLAELQASISASIKASFPKSFHLTLKFLGEIPDEKVDFIKDALKAVEFKPFKLTLSSLGCFPGAEKPRVVWAGFEEAKELMELQKQVDEATLDWAPRDSRFHPHVTLARVKFLQDRDGFTKALSHLVEQKKLDVKEFELIKSVLTPQGPLYEPIGSFPAKGL